jgi:hypothetical protein
MTLMGLLAHLAGFVAPALVVALMLCLMPRIRRSGRQGSRRWISDLAWLWLAGVLVLLAGLLYFDRDGKMATYAVLVLVQGSLGWWLQRR